MVSASGRQNRRWLGHEGESVEPFPASVLASRLQKSAWSFVVADPVTRLTGPPPHHRCGPNGAATVVPRALEWYVVSGEGRQSGGAGKAAECGPLHQAADLPGRGLLCHLQVSQDPAVRPFRLCKVHHSISTCPVKMIALFTSSPSSARQFLQT